MTGENSTKILRQQDIDLDKDITDVMPDTWEGHARALIKESDTVPRKIEQSAIERAVKIAEKNDISTEAAAQKLVEALADTQ